MKELQELNKKTPHTLGETNKIYNAMYVSMKKAGLSTAEVLKVTEKLSIAAKAGSVEFNSLLAGVDGLATGTVLANSDLGRFLGALGLTNDKLKNSKDLFSDLNEALGDFQAINDMDTAISNLTNAWDGIAGKVSEDIFKTLKKSITDISKYLETLTDEEIQGFRIAFNEMVISVARASVSAVRAVENIKIAFNSAGASIAEIVLQVKGYTEDLLDINPFGKMGRVEDRMRERTKLSKKLWETTSEENESYRENSKALEKIVDSLEESIKASQSSVKAKISEGEETDILTKKVKDLTKSKEELREIEKKIKADEKAKLKAIRDEADAMSSYSDAMANATMNADELHKYNQGNQLAELGKAGVSQADLYKLKVAQDKQREEAQEDNTRAIVENTDILKRNWQSQVKGATIIDGLVKHAQEKRANMFGGALGDYFSLDTEMEQARLAQIKARDKWLSADYKLFGVMYEKSIEVLEKENEARRKQIKAIEDSINALQSISDLLSNNWYERARENLFGGTKHGRSFEEAKANARAAWDLFQTDTTNQDFLKDYNKRMDELIGTLDDFKDWTKYNSKAEQTFAKHKALRDVADFQDAQDTTKSDIDRQIEELQAIKEATQAQIAKTQQIINKKTENDRGDGITGITSEQVTTGYSYRPTGKTGSLLKYTLEPEIGYDTKATIGPINRVGYRDGGFTGNVGVNDVAGMVHGQEYVLTANTTKNLGLNENDGGIFKEMARMMYEQLKVTKRMHNLEKQMYQLQLSEVA